VQVPSYEDVITTFELDILKGGGDFQLTDTGSLKLTRDGDLQLGADPFNAQFRLVQRWRFNEPTLKALFDAAMAGNAREKDLGEQVDAAGAWYADAERISQWRSLKDEIAANEFGRGAYAGALLLVLNNLLSRYWKDLGVHAKSFELAEPMLNGCSVGAIIRAAANNFRHHDEWAPTGKPTTQQIGSILTLAAALNVRISPTGEKHPFGQNVCPAVIEILSGGCYDRLNQNFFAFVKGAVNQQD
jgi:hypothetical protein